MRFFVFFLGCRVNQAEIEELRKKLLFRGFQYSLINPDFIIINSCAVTVKAERETRQLIYQIHRNHPKTVIYLTGCAATLWKKNDNPIFLGNNINLIENSKKNNLFFEIIDKLKTEKITNSKDLSIFEKSGRHIVKIQDGCHRFCSYCIVPYLRGKPKSRKISEIIQEINQRPRNIKEVILTAVNTEDFGVENEENFVQLIKEIIFKTNIEKLSFGSINPWSVTSNFIKLYKENLSKQRIADYFHIPIQSGSNKILAGMERDYKADEIGQKLEQIAKINPFALLSTDIIVGFPGENDQEFKKTYDFIQKSPFNKLHIFPYSERYGTKASILAKKADRIDKIKIKERSSLLSLLVNKKYSEFQKKIIGQKIPGLFLAENKGNYRKVLLNNQIAVWVKSKSEYMGTIKEIIIQSFHEEKLYGEISNN